MCEGLSSIHNNPIIPHPVYIAPLNADLSNLSARSGSGAIEGPSKVSGPIASHFESTHFTDYYVAPKVRNAGGANFSADKKGNGVGLLIAGQSLSAKKKRCSANKLYGIKYD